MNAHDGSPTLTSLLRTSNELLHSVWSLQQRLASSEFSQYQRLVAAFPEFCVKLQKRFLEHPVTEMKLDKPNEQEALAAVKLASRELVVVLQPVYDLLKECLKFQSRTERLLADLHTLMMPLTLGSAPLLVREYMRLFSNACRLVLLLKGVPRKDVVQMYTIACHELVGRDPPGRRALCSFLAACDSPVALLQHRFLCVSQRVCQILELVVVPVLTNISSADVLASSQVLDTFHLDRPHTMGIHGFSLERTYQMLQDADEYRSWALLGFLACPPALAGHGARGALAGLLSEGLLLHVYEDVTEPLHPLFEEHVRPGLERLTEVIRDHGADRTARDGEKAAAKALVEDAWRAAAAGAAREHALRRLYICRMLQDLADELEDVPCLLPRRLPALLAAMAYAKAETLWYFRHVGEALAAGPAKGPLGTQPTVSIPRDVRVVQLLAAVAKLHQLLVRYTSATRAFIQERMRAALLQQLLAGTRAIAAAAAAQLEAAQRGVREAPRLGDAGAAAALHVAQQMADIADTLQIICGQAAAMCGASEAEEPGGPAAAGPSTGAAGGAPSDGGGPAGEGDDEGGAAANEDGPASAAVTAAVMAAAGGRAARAPAGGVAVVGGGAGDLSEPPLEPWLAVCVQLCSTHSALRSAQLELPAKDPQYVQAVNELLESWTFVANFAAALRPACDLGLLIHYAPKIRSLAAAVLEQGAAGKGEATDCLASCPDVLHVLRWFDGRTDASGADGADAAAGLADGLLRDQCASLRALLLRAARELHDESALPPAAAVAAAAAAAVQVRKAEARWRAMGEDATGDAPASRDQRQEEGGARASPVASPPRRAAAAGKAGVGGPAASLVMRASYLAAALDRVGAVQISETVVKVPREFMRASLQHAVHELLNTAVAQPQGPPPPSQLAARVRCLQACVAQLAPALGFDLAPDLFESVLLHCQPEPGADVYPLDYLAGAGDGDGGLPGPALRMVDAYGTWMQDVLVRDVRGIGVMYSPAARSFTCVSPGARAEVAAYASLGELTALFRVFGPYAAQVLASHFEQPVAEGMAYLDSQLAALHDVLEPIMAAMSKTGGRCLPEVRAALPRASGAEAAVLTTAKLLGRCLALRQLIAEAAAAAMRVEFPVLAGAPEFAGSVTGAGVVYDPPRHACDVFELPRPGARAGGAPRTADPFVTRLLVGNNSYERYHRWFNLPALLGLALASPTVGAARPPLPGAAPPPGAALAPAALAPGALAGAAAGGAPAAGADPGAGTMSNEMHTVAFAAKCLALAHREAANKMLQCGSQFLHPGAEGAGGGGQATDALEAFSRVAAAVTYSRDDPACVKSCKHLVLAALDCDQLPSKALAAAWLPPARRWSAAAQAARSAAGF